MFLQKEKYIKSRATQKDVQGSEADTWDMILSSLGDVEKRNHHHHSVCYPCCEHHVETWGCEQQSSWAVGYYPEFIN